MIHVRNHLYWEKDATATIKVALDILKANHIAIITIKIYLINNIKNKHKYSLNTYNKEKKMQLPESILVKKTISNF